MKTQNLKKLKEIVANFKKRKILVVGDLILDEFVWGSVNRISPEAPVPVVWVMKESFIPGGACNVAGNITALGGKALLAGVIGDDERGSRLKAILGEKGIDSAGIFTDKGRPTTLKTRVVAHSQQVVRIDKEVLEPIDKEGVSRLASFIKGAADDIDGVIIEDYGKGVIVPALLKKIIPFLKARRKLIAVDPKEEHFSYYRGVGLITPNENEAGAAVGFKIKSEELLHRAGQRLLDKFDCEIAVITRGENGMAIFQRKAKPKLIPTVAQEVYDVSGAGDTVIAVFTLSLLSGATPIQAAHISNCAGGIVVGKVGTAVVRPEELTERMELEAKRGLSL